jgi:hypothetical protein
MEKRKISFSSLWNFIIDRKFMFSKAVDDENDAFYNHKRYLDYYWKEYEKEKHVENYHWHGYLDWCHDSKFIEVKRRSKLKIDLPMVVQCEIYKRITKTPYEIHIWDRKHPTNKPNYIVTCDDIPDKLISTAKLLIDFVEQNFSKISDEIYHNSNYDN